MEPIKKVTKHKWMKNVYFHFLAVFIMMFLVAPYSAFAQGWEASEEVILEHEERRPRPNWREENVPEYVLPDLLGTAKTADDWETNRSQEVLNLLWEYVYGRQLGDPDNIEFSLIQQDNNAMDGAATLKRISINSSIADRNHSFELIVFVPNNAPKPVPLLMLMNHRSSSNTDPSRDTKSDFWPAEEVIARGYGIASFQTGAVSPDHDKRFKEGAIQLIEGNVLQRPDDAPMMLSAWAWGASRAMDYFETDTDIDATRIGTVGHSRGGKASLLAGAQDRRIALVVSNGSGCMGAALTKREFGERIHNINRKTHWFNKTFKAYDYKEPEFPVDQHMLIALIAPRLVYVASADEDLWADPRGEFQGMANASPVYELYGYNPISPDSMPSLNEPMHEGPRGYHIRPGKHNLTLYDWQQFLDFADKNLASQRGK